MTSLAAVVTGLPNEKVGFDGDNFRSPLASGAMLKEKPFAKPGADDVTALEVESEVLAAVVVVEERLPNEANGDEVEEAAPNVEVGVEPSDRLTPNAGVIPKRGAFDVMLLLLLLVAPPGGWKLNENGEAVVGWVVLDTPKANLAAKKNKTLRSTV